EPPPTPQPPQEPAVVLPAPAPPPPPAREHEEPPPSEVKPTAGDTGSGSVIRVDSAKLDQLLNLVGELSVVRTRVKRRLGEIEESISLWEETTRFRERRGSMEQLGTRLHELRNAVFADEVALDGVARELEEGIHNLRLLPVLTLFSQFPRLVRDLARQQDKRIALLMEGGETTADKRIIEEMKSPLVHLVRNAVDHGVESPAQRQAAGKPEEATIRMRAMRTATHVVLDVSDDGRGLDLDAIRRVAARNRIASAEELEAMTPAQVAGLIFHAGFSTSVMVTDVSGRGVGLDVVRVNVERLKGSVQVESSPGNGCRFIIRLPITLATTPVFIVGVGAHRFAIPLDFVQSVRRLAPDAVFRIEGREAVAIDHTPLSLAYLGDLLELRIPRGERATPPWPCIILTVGEERFALLVDLLLDELEVVMKPHGGILSRVRNIAGATILGSGEVCMVLNPADLLKTLRKGLAAGMREPTPGEVVGDGAGGKKTILLAEDSITTRIQEKRILEGAGYEVVVAVDGADAFNKLCQQPVDAVVSDIQMPNMDGLTLTTRIRQQAAFRELPVILVTSLASDEDLRRGLEAGANAYLTKPTFDQGIFLETLRRLV
ncbi:MAG: response regulator, partial [Magnetococcales bacterium]|nr:response regulator [Magnetococcales bacterium]